MRPIGNRGGSRGAAGRADALHSMNCAAHAHGVGFGANAASTTPRWPLRRSSSVGALIRRAISYVNALAVPCAAPRAPRCNIPAGWVSKSALSRFLFRRPPMLKRTVPAVISLRRPERLGSFIMSAAGRQTNISQASLIQRRQLPSRIESTVPLLEAFLDLTPERMARTQSP